MMLLYILLGLMAAAFVFFCLFGYVVFKRVCQRKKPRPNSFEATFSQSRLNLVSPERLRSDYEWFNSVASSELCISSKDKLQLFATLIKTNADTPKGVVLLFHGYRSSGVRDLCLQTRILHNAGYHLLIADQRSHGRSEGKYICYGIKEREDVMLWRDKIAELFGSEFPVCLMGLSMGGATVLMTSELVNAEDKGVRCVVADCPFSKPLDIVAHVMKKNHKLSSLPLIHFVNLWCRVLAHFGLSQASSKKAAKYTHLPILLFHGEKDDYVPTRFSFDIQSSAPDRIHLITVKDAAHGEAIFCDERLYTEELLVFLEKNMKKQ